jgi:hypothetical protein
MKTTKILTAGALALAMLGTASAQTVIRMTGSTAFRKQTISAIIKLMGGSVNGDTGTLVAPATMAYTGADTKNLSANAGIYKGTIAGNSVTVLTSWSGSNGGIQVTAGSIPIQFIPLSQATSSGTGTKDVPDPRAPGTPNPFENGTADVTMMDTFQASTPFLGNYLGTTYATLAATRVGVIPYQWVASEGTPATLNNMTPLIAQAQWKGLGTLPLSFYTGLVADAGTTVFTTGRNPESGTRNATFTESGIGSLSVVQQYDPATGALYPATTLLGIPYGEGEGGENSGGTIATKISSSPASFYVSYLGINDAEDAVDGGARAMTWNGVAYTPENVIEGKYTFWTYEHLGYRSSTAGVVKTVADAIATQILLETAPILLNQMHVERFQDGGPVSPL